MNNKIILDGKRIITIVESGDTIISENDSEMDIRARCAVKSAIEKAEICKKPVARYDAVLKKAYLEFANGESVSFAFQGGEPTLAGLDFYRRAFDDMLEKGVSPFIMLYHWDLPQRLSEKGGWLNRDTADYLADLADVIYKTFPKNIPYWGTILEPQIHAYHGYWDGKHAPGIKDFSASLLAAHNLLRAHGKMVNAFRASGAEGEIGITNYLPYHFPISDSPEDLTACRRWDGVWPRPSPPVAW